MKTFRLLAATLLALWLALFVAGMSVASSGADSTVVQPQAVSFNPSGAEIKSIGSQPGLGYPGLGSATSRGVTTPVAGAQSPAEGGNGAPPTYPSTLGSLTGPAPGTPGSWTPIGPQPIGYNSAYNYGTRWGVGPFSGRVTAIAVNSSDPDIVYIGGAQGGVWKSQNAGLTWTPLTEYGPSLAIGALVISPDGHTLYAGTGEGDPAYGSYYGEGILASSDGGETWSLLGQSTFAGLAISSIIINPSDPSQIMVSTVSVVCCLGDTAAPSNSPGVYVSLDGGQTWSLSLSAPEGVGSLTAAPQSETGGATAVPLAGTFAGQLWTYVTPSLSSAGGESSWTGGNWVDSLYLNDPGCKTASIEVCRVAVASTPALPDHVYVAYLNSTGSGAFGVMVNYDFMTATYVLLGTPPNTVDQAGQVEPPCGSDEQGALDMVLAADPTQASVVYFGCTTLYGSTDGGQTWVALGGYTANSVIHPDMHSLAFGPGSPAVLYSGGDGGLWMSSDEGTTWTNLNAGLDLSQLYSIAVSPSGNALLIGTQDNACSLYTQSLGWVEVTTGDGSAVAFDPADANTMYCSVDGFPSISHDGGHTWQGDSYGLFTYGLDLNPPLAQDPSAPGTLYYGLYGIFKSENYGANWTSLINDTSPITAIGVAPSDANTLYAGDLSGNVIESTDGGATWTLLGSIKAGGTPVGITSIAVNPTNPDEFYVSVSTFGEPNVIQFLNNAASPLSTSGLPASNVNVLRFYAGRLFAGMDSGGVYYLPPGGTSWLRLGGPMPHVAIFDMVASNHTIYVATYGLGVWKLTTGLVSPPENLTLSYAIHGGGSGFSAPAISYVYNGLPQSATLSEQPKTFQIDWGSTLNISNVLPGSSSSERWITGTTPMNVTSSENLSVVYFNQFAMSTSYSVSGGGSPSAPTLSFSQLGSQTSVNLSTSPEVYWADAGSSWQVTSTLPGSSSTERWITLDVSGSVTKSAAISPVYYHEYYLVFGENEAAGGSVTPVTGWYNATTQIHLTATASSGWRFEGWVGSGPGAYTGNATSQVYTVEGAVSESANFYPGLAISAQGSGSVTYSYASTSGTVKSGTSMTIYAPPGTVITLTSNPSLFLYSFSGWTGPGVSGSSHEESLTLNSPGEVVAKFGYNIPVLGGIGAAIVLVGIGVMFVRGRATRKGTAPAPTSPPSAVAEASAQTVYCANCGQVLLPSDRFCPSCGANRPS